jgi:hypothetical protein
MSRAHDPLYVDPQHLIPPEFVSVSYTRPVTQRAEDGGLEAIDGALAAKRSASAVELRLDVKACPQFTEEEKARIVAFRPLRADRRGVVRVVFGDDRTRPKNLVGARKLLADLLVEAMRTPIAAPEAPKARRGRAGLIKQPPGDG